MNQVLSQFLSAQKFQSEYVQRRLRESRTGTKMEENLLHDVTSTQSVL